MNLADYTYELPEHAIALHPPLERGESRLLVLDRTNGKIEDSLYKNLSDFVKPNDLLVINNTKVLPARIIAQTEDGAERELLLLEQHGHKTDHHQSLVMYRRKIRNNQKLTAGDATITIKEVFSNGTALVISNKDLWDLADEVGSVPLPPYMHRDEEPGDRERYQTVFAREKGSVAAPTASLNLTEKLLDSIKAKGVEIAELTLHVGLGTFMPIRVDDVTKHKMHQEYFEIPTETIEAIQRAKAQGGRVIAVGTTVTRTLEYVADQIGKANDDKDINGEADIFIYPGYEFKIVDGLLTNYHAPQSTVLMMASAFAGWDNLRNAYEHALMERYKFLSYGDSMLII
ncbi:MAG: S-adenosylmethionine:tRNA ribosyltransferase-isomerase [Patescibacteria group bacterium]|nr:S-adenosylmethionine:tRNA ribosyltransferase-isomerase [Patescibacteria group bacterium]